MKARAGLSLLVLALLPLGCPLLLDDDFVLIESPEAGGAGGRGGATGKAGSSTSKAGSSAEAGAPAAMPCPASCDSCDADTCVIECQGEEVCKERMVKCPGDRACHIACSGKDACLKLHVTCPASLPCSVQCAGHKDACKDTTVTCGTNRCEALCLDEAIGPQLTCGKSMSCADCG
jgi:hypothetical protein